VTKVLFNCLIAAACLACTPATPAQSSFAQHFFAHNDAAGAVQPNWPTPLVEADPRLTQYYRASVSTQRAAAGNRTTSYGNGRGGGIIAWNRAQFDLLPPPYVRQNSAAPDGFGDPAAAVKYRISSGGAGHGNYIVSAILSHSFAAGGRSGAATDYWNPALAGGIAFLRRFNAQSSLGGAMPTGKIAAQGRSIAWNSLVQAHPAAHVWLELENNATFYHGGAHDGRMQNFITPGAFYVFRSRDWSPAHPFLVFDGGMQVATSGFHTYNHNLIAETRLLF
jgi:hypothetical protein